MEKEEESVIQSMNSCECIPKWLQTIPGCFYCRTYTTPYTPFLVLVPCGIKKHKAHVIPLFFHPLCFDLWKEKISGTLRRRLIDIYTKVPSTIGIHTIKVMSDRCLSKHVLTNIQCKHCYVNEQVHCHFYRCSKCRSVAYCSHECQKKDWVDHKQDCFKRPKQNTLQFESTYVKACDCMSKRDKKILQRSFTNLCNNLSCTRLVKRPIVLHVIRILCSSSRQEHKVPVIFCGISCQRKWVF